MALYIIMIVEGLLYLYNFLGYAGFVPYLQIFDFNNNYINMAKAVLAQFSLFFSILLLILGGYLLIKRIRDKNSVIDKDNIFNQMMSFVIFFGILVVFAFL